MKYNWEAISAIGSWFGGMATFLAVVVALWQTKLSNKKSLKLAFNRTFLFDGLGGTTDGIFLTIMNTGNRTVTIEEWGFTLNDGSALAVMDNGLISIGAKLPVTIEQDSSVQFYMPLINLANAFINAIHQSKITENDKIQVYARDSFSKRYNLKTKAVVKHYLQPVR